MQKKTDRRVRKTKTQLRNGLAMLMKEKSVGEITVKELVDQVDINRSTFYLHYPDISGLLYEIENDLAEEMERAIREHPIEKREDNGFYFLQDIFQTLWLFHHAAARVSIEQSGKAVLHIIEPALNDLRLRISDDSICHIDSQAFEYARRFKGLLAILWFLLPVAKAANIEGQELSTVIHVDVIRDAIFQDSLPERDQRCL